MGMDREGVWIGKDRVCSLVYTDDMVLLAEEKKSMKSILERLESYLDRKGLEMNVGKTKVVRFRERRGRLSKAS